MDNLRERKKEQARIRIVTVAQEMFLTNGYENTTIGEIAKKADVGVGTIYNYFNSKAELFLSMFDDEIGLLLSKGEEVIHNKEIDVVTGIVRFIEVITESFTMLPKKFWKEIFAVIMGNFDESRFLFDGFLSMDMKFLEQLKYYLEINKANKKLSVEFDVETAVQTIYSLLAVEVMVYIYQEPIKLEDMIKAVHTKLTFIFSPYIK